MLQQRRATRFLYAFVGVLLTIVVYGVNVHLRPMLILAWAGLAANIFLLAACFMEPLVQYPPYRAVMLITAGSHFVAVAGVFLLVAGKLTPALIALLLAFAGDLLIARPRLMKLREKRRAERHATEGPPLR